MSRLIAGLLHGAGSATAHVIEDQAGHHRLQIVPRLLGKVLLDKVRTGRFDLLATEQIRLRRYRPHTGALSFVVSHGPLSDSGQKRSLQWFQADAPTKTPSATIADHATH
ncbi:hypothetical protein A0U93_00075 [Neoasaia chiangmaiensis]|uniref:Uncharacterized protein n=1 Tax=Neoasaia chiangmaiensis TaxID=320497 RepID=A0A1U9KLD2_9PROT|nr:hypothetical protein A0U93_00075 [Neoasaia chiangmaiensis]